MNLEYIKRLREETGENLINCKKALEKAENDFFHALEILRESAQTKSEKTDTEKHCSQGVIGTYVHSNGKIAALVEVRCETDFVANTNEFKQLAHDLAMQVVATNPTYLAPTDISEKELNTQKAIYMEELVKLNKPQDVIDKVIAGKLDKYYSEICLFNQWYIKDDKIKIQDLINGVAKKVGEKIEVVKFARFAI